MIRPIDVIPENVIEKRKSYRENIRRDIREAIDRGIRQFEFVGDYNYKYLHQYASEEARRTAFEIAREKFRVIRGNEEFYISPIELKYDKYISVSYVKRKDDPKEKRVFCRIDMSEMDVDLRKLLAVKREWAEEFRREREKTHSAAADRV